MNQRMGDFLQMMQDKLDTGKKTQIYTASWICGAAIMKIRLEKVKNLL